eukprot:7291941-Prorocentrum_lima.AAC.1
MTSSLVGSEMCIRDRHLSEVRMFNATDLPARHYARETICVNRAKTMDTVSYTHLTLPTICSV